MDTSLTDYGIKSLTLTELNKAKTMENKAHIDFLKLCRVKPSTHDINQAPDTIRDVYITLQVTGKELKFGDLDILLPIMNKIITKTKTFPRELFDMFNNKMFKHPDMVNSFLFRLREFDSTLSVPLTLSKSVDIDGETKTLNVVRTNLLTNQRITTTKAYNGEETNQTGWVKFTI